VTRTHVCGRFGAALFLTLVPLVLVSLGTTSGPAAAAPGTPERDVPTHFVGAHVRGTTLSVVRTIRLDGLVPASVRSFVERNDLRGTATPRRVSPRADGDWSLARSAIGAFSISCVAGSTFCVALAEVSNAPAYAAYVTTNGTTWSEHAVPTDGGTLTAISCPSTTDCFVTGSDGDGASPVYASSTDGGETWSDLINVGSAPFGSTGDDIDCPTTTTCYIAASTGAGTDGPAGAVFSTTDGGLQWSEMAFPHASQHALGAVSCVSASTCVAAGSGSTVFTTDGGAKWTQYSLPGLGSEDNVDGISCLPSGRCVAVSVEGAAWTSENSGVTWATSPDLIPIAPTGVDCTDAEHCWVSGFWQAGRTDLVWASTDGGLEWFPQDVAGRSAIPGGIACVSGTRCFAATAGSLWSTSDGGGPEPPSTTSLYVLPERPVIGQVVYLVAATDGPLQPPAGNVTFSADGSPITFCDDVALVWTGETDQSEAVCGLYFVRPGTFSLSAHFLGSGEATGSSGSGEASVREPGYRLVAGDGGIFDYRAPFHGSLGANPPKYAITACATDSETGGYAMVSSDGETYAFDAPTLSYIVGAPASDPIVAVGVTIDGGGYWLVSRSGTVYAFGDADWKGNASYPGARVVAFAPTLDSGGYWIAFSNGYVAHEGDAVNYGNLPERHVTVSNVVGMAVNAFGDGYWLVGSDGGVFAFGATRYKGSEGGKHLNKPIVGMAADPATGGYWLVASDGGIFAFGADFLGSAGAIRLNSPILSMSVG
jgi:photosystem II stability/assembly factor-like uncharacterized protein